MSKSREDIIARVQKLLNLAKDSAAAEGEVSNAMAFAKKLMAEYDLSEADLLLKESENQVTLTDVIQVEAFARNNQLPSWHIHLHQVICALFDVKCFISTRPAASFKGKRVALVFYGLQRDAAMAVMFYNELRIIGSTSAKLSAARHGVQFNRTYERSYFRRFISRLTQRAHDLKKQTTAESATMGAIVLRKTNLLAEYEKTALKLKEGKASARRDYVNPLAFSEGVATANKVDLTPSDRKVDKTPTPALS